MRDLVDKQVALLRGLGKRMRPGADAARTPSQVADDVAALDDARAECLDALAQVKVEGVPDWRDPEAKRVGK